MTTKEEKKFLEDNVATFFFKKTTELQSLSNFSAYPVVIEEDGEERYYKTGEHCFHGEKYIRLGKDFATDENDKQLLLDYGYQFVGEDVTFDALDAKRKGGRKGMELSNDLLERWKVLSEIVQYEICIYKVAHHDVVREDLCSTGEKTLVHPTRCSDDKINDCTWEGRAKVKYNKDGKMKIHMLGKNKLGKIWMDVREEVCDITL
jgi:predicted NAD-dependent protein-ADP-ribosyltransferase YbiA (DUF1768 family)